MQTKSNKVRKQIFKKMHSKKNTIKTKSQLPGLPLLKIFVSEWIKIFQDDIPGPETKANCAQKPFYP